MEEIWLPYIKFQRVGKNRQIQLISFVYFSNLGNVKGYLWNRQKLTPDMIYEYKTGRRVINGSYIYKILDELFRGPLPKGYVVHHKDHNKLNDNLDNLERIPKSIHCCHHMNSMSIETRNKLSKSLKGHIPWNKGKKMSEEYKLKLKEAMNRQETKNKLSKALKGKKRSDETKRKISEARKGRKLTIETKAKMSASTKEWWKNQRNSI